MAQQMRAARFNKETQRISIDTIPVPVPNEGQLVVKMAAASLCHSDMMMSQRTDNLGPITIGHEGVGHVAAIHPSSDGCGFKVGDRIGMLGIIDSCFSCEGCQVHASFCSDRTKGGPKIQGLQADGYFADYAVVDCATAIHLPHEFPLHRMSPLFCAGITAFHAVDRCRLEPGQWFAIVGCGGLGQLALRYAKAMHLKVVCLDLSRDALDEATRNGADAVFDVRSSPQHVREIRRLTGKRGCDAAAVFSDATAAFATGQRVLAFNGILMVVGIPEKPLEFPAFAISTNLFQIRGASNGTAAEMEKAVAFTAAHRIIPDVEFRRLEEMPQMWHEMSTGQARKRMVVRFGDTESKL